MSDGDSFDSAPIRWECPRCGRTFPIVDHKHMWTTVLGGIVKCEEATPKQIEEYKKFLVDQEFRIKAAREAAQKGGD
jgi:hypothetical protein